MGGFKKFISESDEVEKFLKENDIASYHIRADGRVDVYEDYAGIGVLGDGPPPVKFGKVKGHFAISSVYHINDFGDWAPEQCEELRAYTNNLKTLKGLENSDIPTYDFTGNRLEDLHDVHKMIPSAESLTITNNPIKKNILGLLKLPKLSMINYCSKTDYQQVKATMRERSGPDAAGRFYDSGSGIIYNDFDVALIIVGSHLGEGDSGVVKAHRELIDLDLDDFAGL